MQEDERTIMMKYMHLQDRRPDIMRFDDTPAIYAQDFRAPSYDTGTNKGTKDHMRARESQNRLNG